MIERLPQNAEKKWSIKDFWKKITGLDTRGRIEETLKKSEQTIEKTELPDRKGEKVVVIRSNGEPTLGVIVGSFGKIYKVCYVVGDELRGKELKPSELEENQKKYNLEDVESSIPKGLDYKIGQKVTIPRTNKAPSEAYITGYNSTEGLYIVGFLEKIQDRKPVTTTSLDGTHKDGRIDVEYAQSYGKFLTKEDLDKLNK